MLDRVIGSYRLTEKIGEGGMGAVYRAVDLVLEREVAIKAIRPELAREPEVASRFRSEAKLLARINHPAIATIYTFLEEGDEFFLVMEFVRGRNFARVLEDETRIPWRRAVALLSGALAGLEHAHQLGIVHRDLKPENLMLTDTGMVKVMDFGVARAIGSNRQTRTGLLVGSLHYMAPEQIRAEEVDGRTDLYALGVVLYEMLTGRLPFVGPSDYAVLRAQVEEDPDPPSRLAAGLPPWLERIVLVALAKEPARRFPSAEAMRQALLGEDEPTLQQQRSRLADLPTLVRPIPRPPSEPLGTLPDLAAPAPATLTPPRPTPGPPVAAAPSLTATPLPPAAGKQPLRPQGSSYRLVPPFGTGRSRGLQALALVVVAALGIVWFASWRHHGASEPATTTAPLAAPVTKATEPTATVPERTPLPETPPAPAPPATQPREPPTDSGTAKALPPPPATHESTPAEAAEPESSDLPLLAHNIERGSAELENAYQKSLQPPRTPPLASATALATGLGEFSVAAQHLSAIYQRGFFTRARRTFGRIARREDEAGQTRRLATVLIAKAAEVDQLVLAAHPPIPVRRAWQRLRRQVQHVNVILG